MRRTLRTALLLAVVVLLTGACSADVKKSEGRSGVAVSPASASSSSSGPEGTGTVGQLNAKAVETGDIYSFDLGGTTEVPSGPVAITLTNNGAQLHQALLVRIKSDNYTDFQSALATGDRPDVAALGLGTFNSGPNAVAPNQTGTVTTLVLPGTYALVDLLTAPDNRSNVQHGMITRIEVPEPIGGTSLPSLGQGQVSINDTGFVTQTGFTGNGTYAIVNQGTRLHDLAIFQLPAGAPPTDVSAIADVRGRSALPAFGGVTALPAGSTVTTELKLTPGTYAFVSLVPDTTRNDFPLDFVYQPVTTVTIA